MTKKNGLNVHLYDFEGLVRETITTSVKLMDYFRMNLVYYQLVSGKGLEFDRIKEYTVGMDPRRIDWKIFARTGELKIRAFKEERKFDIVIVMDVSDSMLLGTTKHTKNQFASIIGGALAFAAVEAGDQVALMMHSDRVNVALDPDADFYHMLNIMAKKQNYGGKKKWETLSQDLIANYSSNSIIFILSDFIDTNPEVFLPDLTAYFSKVYGIMLRDPIDDVIPKGVGRMYLKNAYGDSTYLVNLDKVRKGYAQLAKEEVAFIKESFQNYDQLFFKIHTEEDFGTGFIKAVGAEEVIIY